MIVLLFEIKMNDEEISLIISNPVSNDQFYIDEPPPPPYESIQNNFIPSNQQVTYSTTSVNKRRYTRLCFVVSSPVLF